jgi:hypothetical protein
LLGDYDGDKGLLVYYPPVVNSFRNAPLHFSNPPTSEQLERWFYKDTETVSQLLQRTEGPDPFPRIHALQEYLLGGLQENVLVGKYSSLHEYSTYTLGYSHPTTIELAQK